MEPEAPVRPSQFVEFARGPFAVPLSVLIAGVMVSVSVLVSGAPGSAGTAAIGDEVPEEAQVGPIKDLTALEDDDPVLGNPDAPVSIVEFSDLQCPFCRQFFTATFAQLKKDYIDTGKVKLIFRDFPLSFHPAARPSALAAECADEQGKFWEYHDLLFAEQAKQGTGTVQYGLPELKQWARTAGLNGAVFDGCLDSEKYADEVDKDFEDGQKAGVSGTPSFFVNGQILVGAQPFSAFQAAIDAALE